MRSTAHEILDDLRKAISALDAGLSEASAKAGKQLGASAEQAQSRFEGLKRQVEELSKRIAKTARAADGSVRDNPWEALGVAAALGFLAGYMVARGGLAAGVAKSDTTSRASAQGAVAREASSSPQA